MRMTKIIATGLLISAAMALPASAGTKKPSEVRTNISKADLTTQAGIEKTYTQLQKTAAESCQTADQKSLAYRVMGQRCEARLMKDFIANIDHADLTAYHQSQTNG